VLISGFGKFSVQEKNQRRGRNPQSGEPIMLAPRKQSNQQITKVPRAHTGCKSRSRSYRTNTLFQQ
jgi:nucleoid DNA-binding protein